jgi:hypothetical protein
MIYPEPELRRYPEPEDRGPGDHRELQGTIHAGNYREPGTGPLSPISPTLSPISPMWLAVAAIPKVFVHLGVKQQHM